MKKIPIFLLCLLLSVAISAQLKNYNQNGGNKTFSDNTHLQITKRAVSIGVVQQSFGAVLGALLPPTIDFISTAVKQGAKRRALLFKGEFKADASESGFYKDVNTINLPDLTLTRKIMLKGQNAATDAVVIKLTAELSEDKTAFRYKLASVVYNYSIAKTKGNYDYIETGLEIKLKTVALIKDQYEVKDLRGTTLVIPMIKVGDTYSVDPNVPIYSGWLPFPPKPSIEMELNKIEKEVRTVVSKTTKDGKQQPDETNIEETSVAKKSNETLTETDNASVYEIEVNVVETNPYKIKAENKQQLIENSSETGVSLIKAVFEQIFKKKDSEDKNGNK